MGSSHTVDDSLQHEKMSTSSLTCKHFQPRLSLDKTFVLFWGTYLHFHCPNHSEVKSMYLCLVHTLVKRGGQGECGLRSSISDVIHT